MPAVVLPDPLRLRRPPAPDPPVGPAQSTCAVCAALLAYIAGRWQHTSPPHRCCDDPEPVVCAHTVDWSCGEPADLAVRCAYRLDGCCGCCWLIEVG